MKLTVVGDPIAVPGIPVWTGVEILAVPVGRDTKEPDIVTKEFVWQQLVGKMALPPGTKALWVRPATLYGGLGGSVHRPGFRWQASVKVEKEFLGKLYAVTGISKDEVWSEMDPRTVARTDHDELNLPELKEVEADGG